MISAAFYLGHDASVAITDGKRTIQIEFEKLIRQKHYQASSKDEKRTNQYAWCLDEMLRLIKRDYGIDNDFDNVWVKGFYFKYEDMGLHDLIKSKIKHKQFASIDKIEHHRIHTWSAYHQSPFERAIVMTYDGGGDSHFSMITGIEGAQTNFQKGDLFNIGWLFCNLPDLIFKHHIKPQFGNTFSSRAARIDHAGKLMGLSAYGKYGKGSYEAIEYYFNNIYLQSLDGKTPYDYNQGNKLVKFYRRYYAKGDRGFQGLTPKQEQQIAWELQEIACLAVKKLITERVLPKAEEHDNNLVLGGGVALNVVVNKMIREEFPQFNTYVPSDPGDAGLALGMLKEMYRNKLPKEKYPHLSEIRLQDLEQVDSFIEERSAEEIQLEQLNDLLNEGKIVGFIYGGIEVGPRALCHRSIICDPSFPDMKNKLNAQVKHREWYRPFAPVVCKEDAPLYFEARDYSNLEHMSYALNVRKEWRSKLAAITHVDNTARVQTLSRPESPYIYDLLKMREPKVLLNTSFNIGGRPILNTLDDALWMLDNRGLDFVILIHNDKIFKFDPGEPWVEEDYKKRNKTEKNYV